jgi:branched-chain amino acid transport system permease protein
VFSFWIYRLSGQNPFLSILLLLPLFLVIGAVINATLIRPIANNPPNILLVASILVTLGLSMVISDTTLFLTASEGVSTFGIAYMLPPLNILGLLIPSIRLLSLIIIACLAVALRVFLTRTLTGKMMRAVAQNRDAAFVLGVNIPRISFIAFGLGTSLAAVAGLFVVLITAVTASIGPGFTFKALTVIILGGLGSFEGSIVGAIILGVAESYTTILVGGEWAPVTATVILIIVLVIRPQGLFGRR